VIKTTTQKKTVTYVVGNPGPGKNDQSTTLELVLSLTEKDKNRTMYLQSVTMPL
jgi:hypothetical protein